MKEKDTTPVLAMAEKSSDNDASIEHKSTKEPTELDPHIDRRVNRKFDLHILPFIWGIWLFSYIDRSNIGNAKIDGLVADLGIEQGTSFNVALLVFYVGYIVVQIPSGWILKRVRAGVYLPALMAIWGVISTCTGFVKTFEGLVACRVLLGFAEGGIVGGVIIYLAMFYKRHELMMRCGMFYSASPLSGAFGGLLASGLGSISYGGYNRWPWIFFIEGSMTVAFTALCFLFMPSTPAQSRFLTEDERRHALLRMRADAIGSSSIDVDEEKFSWHWVRMAVMSPQTYCFAFLLFFLLIPLYSFGLFLPSIIYAMGYTSTIAQLLTAPPNLTGFLSVLVVSFFSDKLKVRGPFIAVGTLVGIVGYGMLLASERNTVKYAGTFLIGLGMFPAPALLMAWTANNFAPHYVRATGVGMMGTIANFSAFIGTFIYVARDAPQYHLGHSVALGGLCFVFVITCITTTYFRWENGKRDRGERDDRLLLPGVGRLGHKHPSFRFTL